MPCLQPTGGCTPVGGCADCGSSGGGTDPVLPKCQDVSLTPGSYTNATIVVNDEGCIASVASGEAPVYVSDDCCGESTNGSGGVGPRGPKGDPGAGSTVAIDPVIETGTGDSWIVENIGSPSAAVFKFTAPALDPSDCCPTGATGAVCGLQVEDGQVKALPPSLVTSIETQRTGEFANFVNFVAGQNSVVTDPCGIMLTINLDAFYYKIKEYIDNEVIELSGRVDANEFGVGVNGDLAYNSSSSNKIVTVKTSTGTTVATVTVPANGSVQLPQEVPTADTYFVYSGTTLIGAYAPRVEQGA